MLIHVVNCHLLLNNSICFSHFTMAFLLLSGQSVQKGWIGEKKPNTFFLLHNTNTSGHTRGSYAVAQVGGGESEVKIGQSTINRVTSYTVLTWILEGIMGMMRRNEAKSASRGTLCVCVCHSRDSLCLCVCVYFDDPQSKMHSGKEKRRRKLLPHKVQTFQMYTDDFWNFAVVWGMERPISTSSFRENFYRVQPY